MVSAGMCVVAADVTSLASCAVDWFHSLPDDFAAMCLADNERMHSNLCGVIAE